MKKTVLLMMIGLVFASCKNNENQSKNLNEESKAIAENFESYGELISDENVTTMSELSEELKKLNVGDTINSKVKGKIVDVCSKKGCWMNLDMGEETVRVRFKDYGFFVPTDAEGEVIVNGKAFVSETSVEDLKHYAEDNGDSEEDIAKITEPKKTFNFLADGVLLEKSGS